MYVNSTLYVAVCIGGIITPHILISFAASCSCFTSCSEFISMKPNSNCRIPCTEQTCPLLSASRSAVWGVFVFKASGNTSEPWTRSSLMSIYCYRFIRSASRSTCHTGLRSTTTKVQPSVNTVGLCCGGWPSRGSNVRVRVCFCMISRKLYHYFKNILLVRTF